MGDTHGTGAMDCFAGDIAAEHHDGRLDHCNAEPANQVDTVDIGHVSVGDDQVRQALRGDLERLLAVGCFADLSAVHRLEQTANQASHQRIIISKKNVDKNLRRFPPAWPRLISSTGSANI